MRLLPGYSDGTLVYEGSDTSIVRATRLTDSRSVVIKMLNADSTAQQMARFEHEYRVLHNLRDCPAVVGALDLQRHGGRLAMVLEDFPGVPLTDESISKNATPEETVRLAIAVADGLSDVHQRDMVHNAVTPENQHAD